MLSPNAHPCTGAQLFVCKDVSGNMSWHLALVGQFLLVFGVRFEVPHGF